MKSKAVASMLLILGLAFNPTILHAKTLKTCTVNIPGGITEDKSGPQPLRSLYQEVINIVSEKSNHEFELKIAPAERCLRLFSDGVVDIVWPFIILDDVEIAKAHGYKELPVFSMPIIMGGYYIFTRENGPVFHNVQELEGKTIVSARGYGVPNGMVDNSSIEWIKVNSNEQVPKMLKAKRADAAIIQTGWVPMLKTQGLLDDTHHGDVIDFWGGSFAFQFNQEGALLSSMFTNAILKLVSQGKYQEIMAEAPYYIPEYSEK
ncbi:substrate-binding periplasmic protein [Vibrio sp. HN007]|uniref:substrate-binding periplasmic protein n=1 Tax=Vibrio iocasae TaxID=3098914 RepID=UPI0035D46A4D